MPAPATVEQFLDLVRKSGLVEAKQLGAYIDSLRDENRLPDVPRTLAHLLVADSHLTHFQAEQLLHGKARGFILNGKYLLLEHLGAGGMGQVYLCQHTSMDRRVAIKVLPIPKAKDPSYLERFYREARAVAALDHPNIVRAHDIDKDAKQPDLHFLVMEYVDGSSLQDIVKRHGPLSVERAAHYMSQAAWGLEHAHEAGLVHRDIKPGNILVDRNGVVKILDMGLARFFHDRSDNLSHRYDETVLGTTDYLAPEQTLDSSSVDIRADIYSLGATFYYCLTGQTIFGEGSTAQKLIWHTTRQPRPIRTLRPEVPEEVAAVVHKMLSKEAGERYQLPAEVAEALSPWTQTPIPPPPEAEMPHLSPSLQRGRPDGQSAPATAIAGRSSPLPLRRWSASGSSASPLPSSPFLTDSPGPSTRLSARATPTPVPVVPAVGDKDDSAASTATPESVRNAETTVTTAAARPPLQREPLRSGRTARKARSVALGGRQLGMILGAATLFLGLASLAGAVYWALSQPAPPGVTPTGGAAAGTDTQRGAPTGRAPVEGVGLQREAEGHRVKTAKYEALVEKDGCLTSLRVDGVEFLRPGLDISRGIYLHQEAGGTVALPDVEETAGGQVSARGTRGSIQYEFGLESIRCTATNRTDQPMSLFLVFATTVDAAANEAGEFIAVPAKQDWATTTWYAGPAKVKTSGGDHLWPWYQNSQVFQAILPPHESRSIALTPGSVSDSEAAKVAVASGKRRLKTAKYEAVVENDGCLTSLRTGDVEWLWVGGTISRGAYFFDKGPGALKLPEIEQPGPNVIAAKGPQAAVRYEFGPDTLTWNLENTSGGELHFFLVFSTAVGAVVSEQGEWAKAPVAKAWPATTWYAGANKLTIGGGTAIWGPFEQTHQVWEAVLKPGEKRQVTLKVGDVADEEANRVEAVTGSKRVVANPDLALRSPLDYQVSQRRTRLDGQLAFRGKVRPACDKVEVRISGTSLKGALPDRWQALPALSPEQTFDAELPTAAGGWYRVEVRALKGNEVVAQASVDHVGVGEVFVGCGQSNSTNCGQEKLQQKTGMVASFSGLDWRPGDDPQPGVHDQSTGGSYWPAFGDALYEKYHVPIGIASTGHAGSSVNQWQPGGEFFQWLTTRMKQLGPNGFRAVLWHQGESDVSMPTEEYVRKLTAVLDASKKEAGFDFPWFVAQVSYQNPYNKAFPTVRDAQKKLWDSGVALEGPDTDTLTGDNRDNNGQGIHFSAKGNRAHGKLWAEKVGVYLDKVLADK